MAESTKGGGRDGRTRYGAADLGRGAAWVTVPAESRADVSAYVFWKWGTTAMFDIRISNIDVGSYLCMTPENALAKPEKDKEDKYL